LNGSFISAALAAFSAIVIAGCGGGQDTGSAPLQTQSAPVEMAPLVTRVESFEPLAPRRLETAANLPKAERPAASSVKLPPVLTARRVATNRPAGGPGVPAQIGTARDVPATGDAAAMARTLKWHRLANRDAAAVSFTSEGAAGLRIGVLVHKLPADTVIRGYVQGGDTAFEIQGRTILDAIARNRDAGDLSDAGRTYWMPLVENDEVTLEISLPPGTPSDAVNIAVPRLSHLYVKSADFGTTKIGQSDSCQIDVSCVSTADSESRATARMIFTDSAGTFLCTGTLLNDAASSGTPYFLSANHCISTQTAASSLGTFWFYRSTSCNTGILNNGMRSMFSGATLLYASSATDTSFMRLNQPPPSGAVFAAWTVNTASLGESVISIHHPAGDLQKFNQGSVSAFGSCTPGTAPDSFSCMPSNSPVGKNFLLSTWSLGTTEAGSSGAGLFSALGGSRYLIGQLYGGSASCNFPGGSDAFGRLDTAYQAALSRWLSAPAVTPRTAIYRFYNASTGAHFFTSSAAERDWVISAYPVFRFEGVAFYAYGSAISGSSPVHRFFNTRNGRHFFTISAAERDFVLATMPEFKYEGISWYAQAENGGNAMAVYRFFNATLATHFYTINEQEKNLVEFNPGYRLEGVGYYAWATQ
jgi:lysyl endopeptidase